MIPQCVWNVKKKKVNSWKLKAENWLPGVEGVEEIGRG